MSAIRRFEQNVATIGVVQPLAPTTAGTSAAATKARRPNLFDPSQLTTPTTIKMNDGTALTLPTMSAEQATQVQNLFSGVTGGDRERVNDASDQLGQALFAALQNDQSQPGKLDLSDDGDDDSMQFAAPAAVTSLAHGGAMSKAAVTTSIGATNAQSTAGSPYTTLSQATPVSTAAGTVSSATVNAMSTYNAVKANQPYDNQVMATTYMGISGLQSQMTAYAQGMQDRQNQKSAISADSSELRQALGDWPNGTHLNAAGESVITMTYHEQQPDGSITQVTKDLTKDQVSAAADSCDNLVSSMGDQTQLDQIKLQSMSQNYSNALNTMSNIMKASYDTVKNTIGNIHY